jgi:hypothetical protein
MDVLEQVLPPVRVGFIRPRQPVKCAAELASRAMIQSVASGEISGSWRIGHLTR